MDPFLLVKLLLLSCNLDEEANQHFLTRSLRKATACWFLSGAGLVVVGKAAVGGQLWAARPNFVLGSKPSSKFLLSVFANDLSLFPGARHLSVQAVHASPLQATPEEAGPRPITSSRMSAQTLCCALGLGLSLAPPPTLRTADLGSLLQCTSAPGGLHRSLCSSAGSPRSLA